MGNLLRTDAEHMDNTTNIADRYFDLKALAEYSAMGVSTLRHHIKAGGLPCYKVPGAKGNAGKVLVRRSEFDAWMSRFACNSRMEIDNLANEILGNL